MTARYDICMIRERVGRQAVGWDTTRIPGHSRVEWDEDGMSRDPRDQRKDGRAKRVMKKVKELFRIG